MKKIQFSAMSIILAFTSQCVTPPKFEDRATIEAKESEKVEILRPDYLLKSGLAAYKSETQNYIAEWYVCAPQKSTPTSTVVFMHETHSAFESSSVCSHWMTALLLSNGFSVLAINRPGFGKSTGEDDLGGRRTQRALVASIADSQQKIDAAVGLGAGSIASAFFAKQNTNLKWVMFGNGIFDLEIVFKNTNDLKLKSLIENVKKTEGEAGYEIRSIAWDPNNMPKKIGLFHNTNDLSSPYVQAANFADQLRLAEYKIVNVDISSPVDKSVEQTQYKAAKAALEQLLR